MKLSILFLLMLWTIGVQGQPSDLIEHRVWDKTPIHIALPVGKERRIDFPLHVTLQVPASIKIASERIQISENGSVYWIASKAFKKQRVNAITDTGYSYLLDIEAREKGHQHPIAIVDDRIPAKDTVDSNGGVPGYDYDYVDLARFASQSIYAPERLVEPLAGVRRIPVDSTAIPLFKSGDLITEPMAQWVAPGTPTLYVTAVRVTSNSLYTEVLDPRYLRGDFLAASAQHAIVYPAGHDGDTTTWYLISGQPFDEVSP